MDLKPGTKTFVMGVLNVTPDSFFDGGVYPHKQGAVECARQMVSDGADIIDVGGESTRPGSEPVSIDEELRRVIPVIEEIKDLGIPISIDSYKPRVVKEAFNAGASMVNDINGLRTPGMIELAAELDATVVLMHMQGTPKSMQDKPRYQEVVNDIKSFFTQQTTKALDAGVKKENIILDPGIGFGKTLEHNLEILRRLSEFKTLGFPILIGPSRKSFIGEIIGLPPEERLEGTLAALALSIMKGVDFIRVHDVKEAVRVARVCDAVMRGN